MHKEISDILTHDDFIGMLFDKGSTTGKSYKCYFDGACVNPGGHIGAGVHIIEGKKDTTALYINEYTPANPGNSSNVAEYIALINLLEIMSDKIDCTIEIFGDSRLVVNQMNKQWKIKEGLYKSYAVRCLNLFTELRSRNKVSIRWISRDFNTIADAQSKKAISDNREVKK